VLRQAERLDDGKFDVVAVGGQRFRLGELADPAPYLSGAVELLPDEVGDHAEAELAARAVQRLFRAYLDLLAQRGGVRVTVSDLPDEPVLLSHLVAAAIVVDLPHKQRLLEEPDARRRLAAERSLLAREIRITRSLTTTPAPDLRYSPYSQN
jgi:Lon protease-like protein